MAACDSSPPRSHSRPSWPPPPRRPGRPVRGARDCRLFPRDNAWNTRVDRLPVASNSQTLIASIGADRPVHPDFGSGTFEGRPIGIPYTTVSRRQRRVPVSFEFAGESDRGPYPIPRNAPIEGGANADGDRHVLIVDRDRCRLYELFDAHPVDGGARWRAGSGAIFNLRSNRLRPRGWTSADAAGLPILPGLARYEELRRGGIDHALRFTAPRTRRPFIAPARHFASSSDDPSLPPMGLRVRLKRSFDTSRLPAAGPRGPHRAEALRDAARRQRLALVHLRRAVARLGQRPTSHIAPGARRRLRGG